MQIDAIRGTYLKAMKAVAQRIMEIENGAFEKNTIFKDKVNDTSGNCYYFFFFFFSFFF